MSGLVSYIAGCDNCDWMAHTRNAHGLAALHAKHHMHSTWCELGYAYLYSPGGIRR